MRLAFILVFVLCSQVVFGQSLQISSAAEISVITCGPGRNEVYSAFGHSAIRVKDSLAGFDYAFNYGVFDFDKPNFYLNFARGYNYYLLAVYNFQDFRYAYERDNRYVHEQVLNLDQEQKEKVFEFLIWNAQEENRSYRYDYFYNNCATKIRDVFREALKGEVEFDGSYITTDYTIRQLTDLYLKPQPWGDLGIDICLGLPMDKKATPDEYMFLPDYIESSFNHAFVGLGTQRRPLVNTTNLIFQTTSQPDTFNWFHPAIIFTFISSVIVLITWRDWKKGKTTRWIDYILFSALGAIGLLLFALWFFTDHQAASYNFNLAWALPTHLAVPVLLWKKSANTISYFKVVNIICLVLLVLWFIIPQQLNLALMPIVVAVAARSGLYAYKKAR